MTTGQSLQFRVCTAAKTAKPLQLQHGPAQKMEWPGACTIHQREALILGSQELGKKREPTFPGGSESAFFFFALRFLHPTLQ